MLFILKFCMCPSFAKTTFKFQRHKNFLSVANKILQFTEKSTRRSIYWSRLEGGFTKARSRKKNEIMCIVHVFHTMSINQGN